MDADVSIKAPVAGIAMGLILEDGQEAILSDILGDEDHIGDMDFKMAGTAEGLTAIQMDIKIKGISKEVLSHVLQQSREGRLYILEKMRENPTLSQIPVLVVSGGGLTMEQQEQLAAYGKRLIIKGSLKECELIASIENVLKRIE